jgi:hypothetical protein
MTPSTSHHQPIFSTLQRILVQLVAQRLEPVPSISEAECLLWVISGHSSMHQPMSALPLKADMFSVRINVC